MNIVKIIFSIHVSKYSSINDKLIWGHSNNGEFTVKSAYSVIARDDVNHNWKWKGIWRIKIPSKIQMFLWTLVHDKIMTNVQRCARGLCENTECNRCKAVFEDKDHIFRRCSKTVQVWESCWPGSTQNSNFKGNYEAWLFSNILCCRNLMRLGLSNMYFAFVLWFM
ncbi:hypothetical protein ACOSQ3_011854 [Xanthoceras sorbifolium]